MPIRWELHALLQAGIHHGNWGAFENGGQNVWDHWVSPLNQTNTTLSFLTGEWASVHKDSSSNMRVFAVHPIPVEFKGQMWIGPKLVTSWDDAMAWVENLGNDWRLPSIAELEELLGEGTSLNNWGPIEFHAGPVRVAKDVTWIWSREVSDSTSALALSVEWKHLGSLERDGSVTEHFSGVLSHYTYAALAVSEVQSD